MLLIKSCKMIFQMLIIILGFFSHAKYDAGDGGINYVKNQILSDNLVRRNDINVNRIFMSKGDDYIDLAEYLLIRQDERKVQHHSNNLNGNILSKKSSDEKTGINQDFFYKDGFYMMKSDWSTMHGVVREDWYSVVNGYLSVCKKIALQPSGFAIKSGVVQIGTVANLKEICKELGTIKDKNESEIASYFIQHFTPYMVGDDDARATTGIFTGYYYPMLNASRERSGKYRYPIYKKPKDLTQSSTSYTREEISKGVLDGKGLEIFWVDDYVDLFFLHIQGSGMLKLQEGGYAHVKFSAKNNQPYASIGKYMTERKYIKRGEDAREFLRHNPRVANEIMNVNQSYIFFEENHEKSVLGAHGSELVDGRSLAVDNKFIPYGLMLYLDANDGAKIMFSQDTGSAIKGKIRGDIFVGKGFDAGEKAKRIYAKGFVYILVHKNQKIEVI